VQRREEGGAYPEDFLNTHLQRPGAKRKGAPGPPARFGGSIREKKKKAEMLLSSTALNPQKERILQKAQEWRSRGYSQFQKKEGIQNGNASPTKGSSTQGKKKQRAG